MADKVCPKCSQWADSSAEICPHCEYDFTPDEKRLFGRELLILSLFAGVFVLLILVFLDQIASYKLNLLPIFLTLVFGLVEGKAIIENWPDRDETVITLSKRVRLIFAICDLLMVWGFIWGFALFLSAPEAESPIRGISGLLMISAGYISSLIPAITAFRHGLWPDESRPKIGKRAYLRGTTARVVAVIRILLTTVIGLTPWILLAKKLS